MILNITFERKKDKKIFVRYHSIRVQRMAKRGVTSNFVARFYLLDSSGSQDGARPRERKRDKDRSRVQRVILIDLHAKNE